jgi:hypothetical protein
MMADSPVPYDSGVVFGQSSFPAPSPGYIRHPSQPVRTQSLPRLGGQAGAHQPPNRAATVPMLEMHGLHPVTGVEERQLHHRDERVQYPSQGDMDVDDDLRIKADIALTIRKVLRGRLGESLQPAAFRLQCSILPA